MIKIPFVIFTALTFTLTPLTTNAGNSISSVKSQYIIEDLDQQVLIDALLSSLSPAISSAVNNHFGKVTQYDCENITSITRLEPGYKLDVVVRTFEGAHNPPHSLVYITLEKKFGDTWTVAKITSQKQPSNKKYKCR